MQRENFGKLVRETEGSICVFRCAGPVDDEVADLILEGSDRLVQKYPRASFFHDWAAVPSYERSARTKLTKWVVQNRSGLEVVHFLLMSPLLRMGVTVAQLTARMPLISHAERGAFEAELQRSLAAQRSHLSEVERR